MTVRVLTPGLTDRQICEHVLKALHDDEVVSFVIHKPGSHLRLPDGREVVVTAAGEFIPGSGTVLPEMGTPEPVGAC